jgi:hypothetical protein
VEELVEALHGEEIDFRGKAQVRDLQPRRLYGALLERFANNRVGEREFGLGTRAPRLSDRPPCGRP